MEKKSSLPVAASWQFVVHSVHLSQLMPVGLCALVNLMSKEHGSKSQGSDQIAQPFCCAVNCASGHRSRVSLRLLFDTNFLWQVSKIPRQIEQHSLMETALLAHLRATRPWHAENLEVFGVVLNGVRPEHTASTGWTSR